MTFYFIHILFVDLWCGHIWQTFNKAPQTVTIDVIINQPNSQNTDVLRVIKTSLQEG